MSLRFGVGLLTHNIIKHYRVELFEQAYASLKKAFPKADLLVLDNGSDDGTEEVVLKLAEGFSYDCSRMLMKCPSCSEQDVEKDTEKLVSLSELSGICERCKNTRKVLMEPVPGVGLNQLMDQFWRRDVDVVVLSDDDMLWKPDAGKRLDHIWRHLRDDVILLSANLEPCWEWNKPIETIRAGNEPVLLRESVPGCALSFLKQSWPLVGPFSMDGMGQDFKACEKLRKSGFKFGQVDLATHEGWKASTWGNNALITSRPLDKKKWGFDP